jgi:hypothetical protein
MRKTGPLGGTPNCALTHAISLLDGWPPLLRRNLLERPLMVTRDILLHWLLARGAFG